MSYRCSKCRARNRLTMRPEAYIRLPNCTSCRRRMTAYPTRRTDPHYVLDRYRMLRERGRAAVTCHPGRGYCDGYAFPHRRGSKFCRYSLTTTEQERAEREGTSVEIVDEPVPF